MLHFLPPIRGSIHQEVLCFLYFFLTIFIFSSFGVGGGGRRRGKGVRVSVKKNFDFKCPYSYYNTSCLLKNSLLFLFFSQRGKVFVLKFNSTFQSTLSFSSWYAISLFFPSFIRFSLLQFLFPRIMWQLSVGRKWGWISQLLEIGLIFDTFFYAALFWVLIILNFKKIPYEH